LNIAWALCKPRSLRGYLNHGRGQRMNIHEHYDQLSDAERSVIDRGMVLIFDLAKAEGIRLRGDDEAERAVDAVAAWFMSSWRDT